MERTTEAPPAVRPEVPVAPEHDPIADASVAAYSADNNVTSRTSGEQNGLRLADVGSSVAQGENLLDFSTALGGEVDNITLQAGWTVFNMEAIEFATDTMSGSILPVSASEALGG